MAVAGGNRARILLFLGAALKSIFNAMTPGSEEVYVELSRESADIRSDLSQLIGQGCSWSHIW